MTATGRRLGCINAIAEGQAKFQSCSTKFPATQLAYKAEKYVLKVSDCFRRCKQSLLNYVINNLTYGDRFKNTYHQLWRKGPKKIVR